MQNVGEINVLSIQWWRRGWGLQVRCLRWLLWRLLLLLLLLGLRLMLHGGDGAQHCEDMVGKESEMCVRGIDLEFRGRVV